MISLIEAKNERGSLLGLSMEDISSGFIVQEIEGLEPAKATLVTSSYGLLDGEKYQSSKREPRNIVITLGLSPDYVRTSVSTLRNELYNFFMPKSEVTLTFYLDLGVAVSTIGRVESFSSPMFTQEPIVQISIMCFDPDFFSAESTIFNGVTTIDTQAYTAVPYSGTIETGIKFTMQANRAVSTFNVHNIAPDGHHYTIEVDYPIVADDLLIINTQPGSKEVTHISGSTSTPVLYAISMYSDWIKFYPGENLVRVHSGGSPLPFTIEFSPRYGGL